MSDRNSISIPHSGISGGHFLIVKDADAGTIPESPYAMDVGHVEITGRQGSDKTLDKRFKSIGRPFQYYWEADSDQNSGGEHYGFFASAFPTIYDEEGMLRLGADLSEIEPDKGGRGVPVSGGGAPLKQSSFKPRWSIYDRVAIADLYSAPYESKLRSREVPVPQVFGVTMETTIRRSLVTIEEPLLVSAWRGDPRQSNLIYDVNKRGLSKDMISRVSDIVRVTLNEKSEPSSSLNYGAAPDNKCVGHGFAYSDGLPAYLSNTRGGYAFFHDRSRVQHGLNSEGEKVTGAMLKLHTKGNALGSVFFASEEKQGPVHYNGKNWKRGRGVRIVEAWLAYDPNENWTYRGCEGNTSVRGVFKMNSWATAFDPDPGPPPNTIPPEEPPIPPEPPTDTPPGDPRTTSVEDNFDDDFGPIQGDPDEDKSGAPSTGVAEERKPSYQGIPVPPDDSKPVKRSRVPVTGGGRPLGQLPEIERSPLEARIGVEYEGRLPGDNIGNSVYFDRFTYDHTQRSLRNLIRAPYGAHLQVLGKYDSTTKTWDTDGNEGAYSAFDGDGRQRGQTLTTTQMIMPPNIDLGDADLNPSSGVSVSGLAVHRGSDNGFIGIGVPSYTYGVPVSGFRMTYDSDGLKIVAYDANNAQDNSADIFFNGSSISGGGTSYWDRTGTLLTPVNSGDDMEVDGVAAFGTASVSALKGVNIGMSAASGSDDHDGLRSALTTPSGATGDNNALAFTHTLQGTNSRTNARGISANVDNAATGGTLTNLFGMELTGDSSASGSTVTNAVGANIRMMNTGGATHTSAYGVKVAMEDNSTTAVGVEGRIVDGTHTYASGIRGLLKSAGTYNGMGHGGYFEDLEQASSGRSAALATNRDLAFVTNELSRAYARFRGDGTDTVILEEYDGTEAHLDVVGCVKAQAGFKMKLVELGGGATSHTAAWGEFIVVDVTSGTTGVTITLPEASTSSDGDNVGASIIVEAHDLGSGPWPVTVVPGGSDALRSDGTSYADWTTSSNETKMQFFAGYDRTVYAECCAQGGAFTAIPE